MSRHMKSLRRCNRCILPNTSKLFQFDENGTCCLCNLANIQKSANRSSCISKDDEDKLLLEYLDKIKKRGKNRKYDCVVGVSGGRDSTFLLYLLTQKYKFRCLAVYYRTPFTSDLIDSNIRCIVKELGADFKEIEISHEYHKKVASKILKLWKKKHSPLLANLACAVCKLLNREIYKITNKYEVATIIYGANIYEEVQIAPDVPKKLVITAVYNQVSNIAKKVKKLIFFACSGIWLLCRYPSTIRYIYLGIQSSIMYINLDTLFLNLRYPKIWAFNFFHTKTWSEQKCLDVITKLGWQRPDKCKTSWRADCSFAEIKNMTLYKTIGITYTDFFYSNMIRAGVLTREKAIERINTEGKISIERLNEALDALEINHNFFD